MGKMKELYQEIKDQKQEDLFLHYEKEYTEEQELHSIGNKMSEWASFFGNITLKNKVNLSKILQHAPVGSEGGLLLYETEIFNTYIIKHSLRDVEYNDTLKYKIDYWFKEIKHLIVDLTLTIGFRSNNTVMFYVLQDENTIVNSNVEN
jgi:hypothetical protein